MLTYAFLAIVFGIATIVLGGSIWTQASEWWQDRFCSQGGRHELRYFDQTVDGCELMKCTKCGAQIRGSYGMR